MLKLDKRVAVWVERNLLSAAQGEAILRFERESEGGVRQRVVLYGLLILGASVLSIGIVSLVAANWDEIPSFVKIVCAFWVLAALGSAVYLAEERQKRIAFDVLATLFIYSCLAMIGLMSQVFHTGGELYTGLTFWLAITLPLVCLGKGSFLVHQWTTALLTTFFVWAFTERSWFARLYLTGVGGYSIREERLFLLPAMLGLVGLSLSSLLSRTDRLRRLGSSFAFWALLALCSSIVAGDIWCQMHEDLEAEALLPFCVLLPIGMGSVVVRSESSWREKVVLALLMVGTCLVFVPSVVFTLLREHRHILAVLGTGYSVVSLILLGIYFALRGHYRLFQATTIAVGLRFLIVYFQVFEDLAYSGVGLVVSGLLIIGVAIGWFKASSRFSSWAKGLVS